MRRYGQLMEASALRLLFHGLEVGSSAWSSCGQFNFTPNQTGFESVDHVAPISCSLLDDSELLENLVNLFRPGRFCPQTCREKGNLNTKSKI